MDQDSGSCIVMAWLTDPVMYSSCPKFEEVPSARQGCCCKAEKRRDSQMGQHRCVNHSAQNCGSYTAGKNTTIAVDSAWPGSLMGIDLLQIVFIDKRPGRKLAFV